MTYSAEISRDNPTAIVFLIDQSGSMDEKMVTGKSKADFVADVLNKTIYTLVTNCTKSDGVRNYFDIGVIGYGGLGVGPGLGGFSLAALSIPSQQLRIRLCASRIGPASTMMGLAASWSDASNFQFGSSRRVLVELQCAAG
jgi:hypothetical protein